MRFFCGAILATLLVVPAFAHERGAFVAFNGQTYDWCEVFKTMRQAGMNTAILQYTSATRPEASTEAYFYDSETTEFICAAEKAGMNYYLGLRLDKNWDQHSSTDIDAYIEDSIQLITTKLPPKLPPQTPGKTGLFKGWYMALEVGNDPKAVQHLEKLRSIATASGTRIAMSIYFNPFNKAKWKGLAAAEFAAAVRKTISAYDVVLLQDGVRAFGASAKHLEAYYTAIDKVYAGDLWIVVEAFPPLVKPASKPDFSKQIETALALDKGGNVFAYEYLKNLCPTSQAYAAWTARFGTSAPVPACPAKAVTTCFR